MTTRYMTGCCHILCLWHHVAASTASQAVLCREQCVQPADLSLWLCISSCGKRLPEIWQSSPFAPFLWSPKVSLALPFCLQPPSLYECLGNIPLVAAGKLYFLLRHRNNWRSCWQLAALPVLGTLGRVISDLMTDFSLLYFLCHAFYPVSQLQVKWSRLRKTSQLLQTTVAGLTIALLTHTHTVLLTFI